MSYVKIAELIRARKVDVAVFDFDGTLYESSAGIEHQLKPLMAKTTARVLGISEANAIKILRSYRSRYKSSVLGLRDHHGIDPDKFLAEVYDALDLSRMLARPGLRQELERLQKFLPLVVFTNSNRSFTHRALDLLGLSELFDVVFTVEDNGFIRKPEPEAYAGFFQHIKITPQQMVMFDDIPSSLRVISNIQAKTVLIGNGLRSEPSFVDLHTEDEYSCAPKFVDASTHDLVDFLRMVNKHLDNAN